MGRGGEIACACTYLHSQEMHAYEGTPAFAFAHVQLGTYNVMYPRPQNVTHTHVCAQPGARPNFGQQYPVLVAMLFHQVLQLLILLTPERIRN